MRDFGHVCRAESGKGLGNSTPEGWRNGGGSQGARDNRDQSHSKILRDHGCWGNKKQGGDSILLDHLYGGDWCPDFIQAQEGDSVTGLWGGGLKLVIFSGINSGVCVSFSSLLNITYLLRFSLWATL